MSKVRVSRRFSYLIEMIKTLHQEVSFTREISLESQVFHLNYSTMTRSILENTYNNYFMIINFIRRRNDNVSNKDLNDYTRYVQGMFGIPLLQSKHVVPPVVIIA